MDIAYANTIPLREILSKIDLKPIRERKDSLIYRSPFSGDAEARLTVNTSQNTWTDSATNLGGNTIAFVSCHLRHSGHSSSVADCFRWLKNTVGFLPFTCPSDIADDIELKPDWIIRSQQPICKKALLRYLIDRRIAPDLASQVLKEARMVNKATGKPFTALSFANEDEGHTVYNPHLSGHVLPLNISFIRGSLAKPTGIHLFKDIFDYLSALSHAKGRKFKSDALILNAYSCMPQSAAYIRGYGYETAYTWFDNTASGIQVTKAYNQFLTTEPGLKHVPMNLIYRPYPTVNAWLIATKAKGAV